MTIANRRRRYRHVARAAGVSQAIVSYVVNDIQDVPVSPETRQRVQAAISELGYIPNHTARSLRSRRTHTIATIIPDITNPYYPGVHPGHPGYGARPGLRRAGLRTPTGTGEIVAPRARGSPGRSGGRWPDHRPVLPSSTSDLMPILREGTPITLLGPPPGDVGTPGTPSIRCLFREKTPPARSFPT